MTPIVLKLAIILFLLMDPFGNMVSIHSLLNDYDRHAQRKIILRESFLALGIMIFMGWSGSVILNFLGLKESSLRITGGIVLFLISLRMVFPAFSKNNDQSEKSVDPFIVPIAVPLIAGPSALSMVILYSHTYPIDSVLSAIGLSSILSFIILFFSPTLFKWLGDRGSRAIERLTGILLIMVSVQMILDGVKQFFE